MKIQNLILNPKSGPVKSNSDTNFVLTSFPAKVNDKIFQNKEKNIFWGHFSPKGISPKKTQAKCN